jgi:hypothetical protein
MRPRIFPHLPDRGISPHSQEQVVFAATNGLYQSQCGGGYFSMVAHAYRHRTRALFASPRADRLRPAFACRPAPPKGPLRHSDLLVLAMGRPTRFVAEVCLRLEGAGVDAVDILVVACYKSGMLQLHELCRTASWFLLSARCYATKSSIQGASLLSVPGV